MRLSAALTVLSALLCAQLAATRNGEGGQQGHHQPQPQPTPEPTEVNHVTLDGLTYINKGLVAFGLIPANFKDSTGDTMGGFGSAISMKPRSWKQEKNGQFSGTLYVHPDRGYNVISTINYQARHHEIDFVLTPYYGHENLTFSDAQKTLALQYEGTVLEYDVNRKPTSGLDPKSIRFPNRFTERSFPEPLPIVSTPDNRLVLDVEGMIALEDGSFWISDEYAPGVYLFSKEGMLQKSLPLVDALLPRDATGNFNFTTLVNNAYGRTENQGFEGLTMDQKTGTIYAMLQSATVQDGGLNDATSRYTRLFAWDVSGDPRIIGEWVVPLPSIDNKTEACSEIHSLGNGIFMALSRDGNGHGDSNPTSKYKSADLFSINGATNIHGSKFDNHLNPIAVNGVLDRSIRPAEYVEFISYLDPVQLARVGLHNGLPSDQTLLNAKWESFATAPVGDPKYPDDYFLFTVSDNDFLTTQGVSLGVPYNAGVDNDNQFMVFRVTLPRADLFQAL